MTSEQAIQECRAEIRRLRGVCRIQGEAIDRIASFGHPDADEHIPDLKGISEVKFGELCVKTALDAQEAIVEAGLA